MAHFGTDHTTFNKFLDTYYAYSSPTFVQWEGNGESVLVSLLSFLSTNFILSLTLYTLFFVIFRALFAYKVSVIFRPYSFWPYFFFLLMEGNLQMLTFYLASILRLNFFFLPLQKAAAALAYALLFSVVLFAVGGYLLVYRSIKKLIKYFADNVNGSFQIAIYLLIEFGFKNLSLGLVHSLFRRKDQLFEQLGSLFAIELLCLANNAVFLSRKGAFEYRMKVWLLVSLNFMRIILIFLLLACELSGETEVIAEIEVVLSSLVTTYLLTTLMGFCLNFLYILSKILEFGKKRIMKKYLESPTT